MYKRKIIFLLALLALLSGCSPMARQMRQTKKLSRQNVQRQENKKPNEVIMGADGLSKSDVNYKDLKSIRHRCVHVSKKGKRCGRKAVRRQKYCRWHIARHRV
ncbi:MAG: hypothetical protein LBU92_03430 [Prevotellaceae bacterium]|nr:hypothetical protein [Prevotellaceae bacterium]